jgi:hypothetical protein
LPWGRGSGKDFVVTHVRLLLLGLGVSIVAVFAVPAASAFAACTETWTGGGGDGLWTTAANWSPAVIPGNGNTPDVCLPDIGHSYTVTLTPFAGGGGYTINSLTVGTSTGSDTETLQIVGQSYVYNGETQNGEGLGETAGATINATGSLVLDATAGGTKALSGDTLGGPASFGDPSNGGPTILNYGDIVGETSDATWGENVNANITNEPGGASMSPAARWTRRPAAP